MYNTTVFNNNNIFNGLSDHRELMTITWIIIYYNKKTMDTQTTGDGDRLKGTATIQYKSTTVQLITKLEDRTQNLQTTLISAAPVRMLYIRTYKNSFFVQRYVPLPLNTNHLF